MEATYGKEPDPFETAISRYGRRGGLPRRLLSLRNLRKARTLGGKNIRRRSGMMINDTTLIDFPPDIYALSLELGLDLGSVTDLMITHSHGDHFDVDELNMRQNGMFCHLGQDAPPLRLYGNDGVARVMKAAGADKYPYVAYTP